MNHESSRPIVWLIVYGNAILVFSHFLGASAASFRGAALVIFGMALARLARHSGKEADRSKESRKP
jgi:hypothetical protein